MCSNPDIIAVQIQDFSGKLFKWETNGFLGLTGTVLPVSYGCCVSLWEVTCFLAVVSLWVLLAVPGAVCCFGQAHVLSVVSTCCVYVNLILIWYC